MDNSDIEVTKGLIPVYFDPIDGPRVFVGYGEFEKDTHILRVEIDTDGSGSKLKEALDSGISSFSISSMAKRHNQEENK